MCKKLKDIEANKDYPNLAAPTKCQFCQKEYQQIMMSYIINIETEKGVGPLCPLCVKNKDHITNQLTRQKL